jgi:thiamine biosynthesis lipoprotein
MSKLRVIEPVMGTVAAIDIRRSDLPAHELDALIKLVLARLQEIDRTFSTYSESSEITRIGRNELCIDDASPDVRTVLDLCDVVRATSTQAFDIHAAATTEPARSLQQSSRALEPSGMVKGWAIGQAVDMLTRAGLRDFCVNIGGDVYVSGDYQPGEPWRIGLQHPFDRTKVMAVLEIRDTAVATSGVYERGAHIVDKDGNPPSGLTSITVVGPDITLADAYATAAFAKGSEGPSWINELPGFEVFAVDENNTTIYSQGLLQYLSN